METLRPPKGATRQRKRLGRGNGSGHGTTAGKGTKGQNARSGGGVRPGFEGGQMPLYRRVARRGFSNHPFKKAYTVVDLDVLQSHFKSGATVSLVSLQEAGIVGNREVLVKILANGEIKKKLKVMGLKVSRSAAEKIIAAGGSVEGFEPERDAAAAPPRKSRKKVDAADAATEDTSAEKDADAAAGAEEASPDSVPTDEDETTEDNE